MAHAGSVDEWTQSVFVPAGMTHGRDRRARERWTRAQTVKNWAIRWAIRAALVIADSLPEKALVAGGAWLGRAVRALVPGARRMAEERAARCFPSGEAPRIARAAFERAGESLARCVLLRRSAVSALDSVHVDDGVRRTLDGALAEGRGVIFVSAHLGPFEAIAGAVAELGYRTAVVVRESYDSGLDAVVDRHRLARGIEVIHRGAANAPFSIVRALRDGKLVGFLPDLGGRVPSIELPLLGDSLAFPIGPALIAAKTRTPVVVGALAPRECGPVPYELMVERMPCEADPMILTRCVAKGLERAILRAPTDWLWMAPPIRQLPPEKRGH